MSPNKFFLYTRKSTDVEDRQIYSIEHQLAELRQLAVHKGLEIVAELTESRTASMPGRPIFNDMIARIKKGEANGILAWHPDRLARNPIDGGQIMYMIDQGTITRLEFSVFWFEPTPQGNLMLAIAFGMSKYYTDALSQNIKRGLRQRVNDGFFPARPPVGYIFDRNTRTVIPDPAQAPHVRHAYELYSGGEFTLQRLSQVVTAEGLRTRPKRDAPPQPLSLSRLYEMLRNPFYLGRFRFNGQLHEGKHEPLISQSLFDRCQSVMLQRSKVRAPGLKPFLYRGMFKCDECGGSITMEIQKGHTYLHCTKRNGACQPYLRQEQMAAKIDRVLQHFVVPQQLLDDMIADLEEQRAAEKNAWRAEAESIKIRIAAFEAKLHRANALYVDCSMPLADYNKTKGTLLNQKRSWIEKLNYVETTRQSSIEPTIRFIRGLTEARIVAEDGDDIQKRDLLQKTCSNLRLRGSRVLWEARGAWKHVVPLGRFANHPSNTLNTPTSSRTRFSARWSAIKGSRLAPSGMQVFFNDNSAWA